MNRAGAWVACLLVSACASSQVYVAPEEAARLSRTLNHEERVLRVSMYVTPFFGDATRKLVTAVPPDEVRLLENPDGSPVNPGAIEKTLAAGSRVRVTKVEFPSPTVMAERVLFTPRTLLWVTLDAEAIRNSAPLVLVLRPGLRTEAEVIAEFERYLTRENPSKRIEAWPDAVREAIRSKNAVPDMPAEALEMAWGYPEHKRLDALGTQRREVWRWPGRRQATLIDGRVTEFVAQ